MLLGTAGREFLGTPRGLSIFLQISSVISSLLKNENPVQKFPKVIRDSVSTVTYLIRKQAMVNS